LRAIAVDWSGRAGAGQRESIWVAEVVGGRLVSLRNGMTREEVVGYLVEAAGRDERLTVGLDFAFSLPAWWVRRQGIREVGEVWRRSESLLRDRPSPFFGTAGSSAPPAAQRYRRTDQALRAKSVFQLAGPGAVGVGSLRGMPFLLQLRGAGLSVWPFDAPASQRVVEIYPRALTGPVDKGRWARRHEHVHERFPDQDERLLERAAGSEDAFDAAVSALVMGAHVAELAELRRATDPTELLEGRIWVPEDKA
jgi:predicted nuclease with RNAse H fold